MQANTYCKPFAKACICNSLADARLKFYVLRRRIPQTRDASMSISKKAARELLQSASLRTTAPRLAVLRVLSDATRPLSHTEVLEELGETDWDPATIYRNLVKLKEAGVAPVVSRAEGIDRYALGAGTDHRHPHFVCDDCGVVQCLPDSLRDSLGGAWRRGLRRRL